MSLVVAQAEVQTGAPAKSKVTEQWEDLPLHMGNVQRIKDEAVVDVVKMYTRSAKIRNVPITSISNATAAAKDAVTKDSHNLVKINNLAACYLREGQHEMGLNVLMRGWKRAGEIPSEDVRFRFLMKACELSFGLWKFRQALAIFRDITEPVDPRHKKTYLILGCQVWSQNGDLEKGLKFFQRCIDGEELKMAIRILAITCLDLKKAGAFEAAKSTVDNLAGDTDNGDLMMLAEYAENSGATRKMLSRSVNEQRSIIIISVIIGAVFLTLTLYWLESRSLAAMEWNQKST